MGFFPYMGEILWVFLTFMEVFPIPPLSRGRSGGGWGIYVAVVLSNLASFSLSSFSGGLSWAIDGNHPSTIEYDLMQSIISY